VVVTCNKNYGTPPNSTALASDIGLLASDIGLLAGNACILAPRASRASTWLQSQLWQIALSDSWSVGFTQGVVMRVSSLKTEGWGRNPVSTDRQEERKNVFLTATLPVLQTGSEISLIDMPRCLFNPWTKTFCKEREKGSD
jgi:hypothetical protein